MAIRIPNPLEAARREAVALRSAGHDTIQRGVDRVAGDAPWLNAATFLAGIEDFHRERMAKLPSAAAYPESPAWVDYVVTVDRELQELAGLSARQMAILRSMGAYMTFRGYARLAPRTEKCRVVYIPETNHGQFHIKNVDDPLPPNWKPDPERPTTLPCSGDLIWDGVGSGLHLDDEPDEIFPLPVTMMYRYYADDVPGAVQFLTRYSKFFGGQNFVLHDRQKRSVAIEKCSYNFIEVFPPDPVMGFSHCSGMACRDPNSPQGRYQRARRDTYCRLYSLPGNGTDRIFWNACDVAERMLTDGLRAMGRKPRCEDIMRLFTTPWPKGLNKPGIKLHPQQSLPEYTVITHCTMIDERTYYRWQRDEQGRYPDRPEIYQY